MLFDNGVKVTGAERRFDKLSDNWNKDWSAFLAMLGCNRIQR